MNIIIPLNNPQLAPGFIDITFGSLTARTFSQGKFQTAAPRQLYSGTFSSNLSSYQKAVMRNSWVGEVYEFDLAWLVEPEVAQKIETISIAHLRARGSRASNQLIFVDDYTRPIIEPDLVATRLIAPLSNTVIVNGQLHYYPRLQMVASEPALIDQKGASWEVKWNLLESRI